LIFLFCKICLQNPHNNSYCTVYATYVKSESGVLSNLCKVLLRLGDCFRRKRDE
jgi:hypothetical protein